MTVVYPEAIVGMFGPLVGMADEAPFIEKKFRPSIVNESTLKDIYEREIKPEFLSFDPRIQSACKVALRYILNKSDFDYRGEFNSMLMPFRCPDEPRLAFMWLWDVLYPGETPLPLDEPFEVKTQVNALWRCILAGD